MAPADCGPDTWVVAQAARHSDRMAVAASLRRKPGDEGRPMGRKRMGTVRLELSWIEAEYHFDPRSQSDFALWQTSGEHLPETS